MGQRKGSDGWNFVDEFSDDYMSTYENDGKAILHFRGTRPDKALLNSDIANDALIAFGDINESGQTAGNKQRVLNMLDKYGDHNLSLSSYSLGGGKAAELVLDKDVYSRLSNDNYFIVPGITSAHERLGELATNQNAHFIYHHSDNVANALLPKRNDHHTVLYGNYDPIQSHLLLDELDKNTPPANDERPL